MIKDQEKLGVGGIKMTCDFSRVRPIDLSDEIARHTGDRTVAYKTVHGEPLMVSYYFPAEYQPKEKKYPVFFFVHGGGWGGRKVFEDQVHWAGDYLGYLARYYAKKGFVSVSIDYRLIREDAQPDGYQLMDLYEDCMDALSFVAGHAREDGIDPERAVLLGESAGGYLAAAMAAFPYRQNPFRLRYSILVNAITALNDGWKKAIPLQSMHPLLKGLTYEERYRALSPVCQIGENTCPALLLHGTADTVVLPHHAEDYRARLQKAGGTAEIYWLPNTGHAFLLVEYVKEPTAAFAAIAKIDEELAKLSL